MNTRIPAPSQNAHSMLRQHGSFARQASGRCLWGTSILLAASLIGCGSNETTQNAQTEPENTLAAQTVSPDASVSASAAKPVAPPELAAEAATSVVSQFLDEVRRGGEDSRANELLTSRARQALAQIGHSVQPLGSPDAHYEVTRAQLVPGDADAALVHCVWTEPADNSGETARFEVVWAVQRESNQWRISGLAIQIDPNADPVVLDFENAKLMAQHLSPAAGQPQSASASTDQANGQPADQTTLSR